MSTATRTIIKKVQVLLGVALISVSFDPIFSQTRGRKEPEPPAWSQKGIAKAKEADRKRRKHTQLSLRRGLLNAELNKSQHIQPVLILTCITLD